MNHFIYQSIMMRKTSFLVLFLSILQIYQVTAAESGSCGPGCCQQKVVGNISYTLAYESKDLPSNCKDGCVYTRDDDAHKNHYCFEPGVLKVQECLHCKPLAGME